MYSGLQGLLGFMILAEGRPTPFLQTRDDISCRRWSLSRAVIKPSERITFSVVQLCGIALLIAY
jgi:hypothetical protein